MNACDLKFYTCAQHGLCCVWNENICCFLKFKITRQADGRKISFCIIVYRVCLNHENITAMTLNKIEEVVIVYLDFPSTFFCARHVEVEYFSNPRISCLQMYHLRVGMHKFYDIFGWGKFCCNNFKPDCHGKNEMLPFFSFFVVNIWACTKVMSFIIRYIIYQMM